MPTTRIADGFEDKILSLLKTNTPKKAMYGRWKKLSKPKTKNTRKKKKKHHKKKKNKLKIEYLEIFGHFLQQKKKKKKGIREKKYNERLFKDRKIRDVRRLFEQEEKDYYKPKRVNNFRNNYYIEYESNGDKNGKLSLDGYLDEIELYMRNIIIDLQNSYT